ncbi:hypothetical protein CPC08DRAFT_793058 [Agrocybe pediades]|nr:hypothetical protein CPC08DRAFT_793058 [Agrocybe pediades]
MSLPQELCDLIIDETSMVTDKTERSRDLVALSLVCKSFRNRAHKHLFESVNLIHQLEERKTKTARHLLSLFEADPCTETSGLASRISSFTCCFFSPGEDSEFLIGVLRTLFNNPDNTKSHPTPCSLSLISATSMRWSELGDNLLQELSQVCHRPRLASLSIFGFQDFPLHFLRNMSIKHLFISSTSVLRPLPSVFSAEIGDTGRDQGVILETLDLDHLEPPPGPLLVISEQTNPSVIFSNLNTLRYSLYDHMQDALKQILTDCANQLEEVLEVSVLQPNISLISFLPVGFLLPLLDQKEFCPALQTIDIRCTIQPFMTPPDEQQLLLLLAKLEWDVLDNLFAQPQFDQIHSLKLNCRLVVFGSATYSATYPVRHTADEYAAILRSRLPAVLPRKFDFSLVDKVTFC